MPEGYRIVHLAASDAAGLGHSAFRLHSGLLAIGERSSMLVKEQKNKGNDVFQVKMDLPAPAIETAFAINTFQRWYIDHNRTPISNSRFTLNEPGYALENHPLIKEADVLHLHSVGRFLSPAAIGTLAGLGKPVVWTMHDMRPFTGGCHYSAGCANYTSNCPTCPQLAWDPYFITEAQLGDALENIPARRITWVAPTEWLAYKARSSALLREARVEVIPYGVQTEEFPSRWKPQAKNHLGLDPGTLHLLFVANRLGEKRKGFDHVARALQICLGHPDFKRRAEQGEIALISLGHPDPTLAKLGLPYVCLGFLETPQEMSQLYGAADLFLLPSLEENMPNTLLEAMSSGTPPIAFAVGGIPEAMMQDETGRLVPPGDDAEFANAIHALLFDDALRQQMGENCRRTVQERFSYRQEAENYLRLYRELMRGLPRSAPSTSDPFGFGPGNDFVATKLAPISPRVQQICTDSLPRPLQNLILSMEEQTRADQAELHELRDFLDGQQRTIEELQAELDQQRGTLRQQETTILQQKQILGSGAIKMLRQLKLIKK